MQSRGLAHSKYRMSILVLLWTIMMAPAGTSYIYLGNLLDAISPGANILALIAFSTVGIFSALVLNAEFNMSSRSIAEKTFETLQRTERPYVFLIMAATILPFAFVLLGAAIILTQLANVTSGYVLLLTAVAMALSNGLCWIFAHFLLKEFHTTKKDGRYGDLYAAFQVVRSVRAKGKYSPPIHPALVGLAMISLAVFAFVSSSTLLEGGNFENTSIQTIAVSLFVIALLVLLSLSRLQALHTSSKKNHIAFGGGGKRTALFNLNWAAVVGTGILLICLLAALMPLNELIELGRRLHISPPQAQPEQQIYSSEPGLISLTVQWLVSAAGGWLLALIILIVLAATIWLLWWRFRRTWLWQRIAGWAMNLCFKFALWVKRIRGRFGHPSLASQKGAPRKASRRSGLDILEDAEALQQSTPAQVIMAVFHKLLEYSVKKGWLGRTYSPPFEILQTLLKKVRFGADDLTYLTWAYARAAYSQTAPTAEEAAQVQEVWNRLKPQLLRSGK